MTILVTGASGFIGSFIVSEGLALGHQMWAGIRASSSRQYLQDERIHFAELDLGNLDTLRSQLRQLKEKMGGRGWDYVVHAAGATKCIKPEDFYRTNTQGTKNLVEALLAEGMAPRRFVFISSLSVFGAIREEPNEANGANKSNKANGTNKPNGSNKPNKPNDPCNPLPWRYSPILLTDTPQPNTAYGKSKLEAEQYLQKTSGLSWVILRPTGVYGPRERDYFLMAQSIKQHVDFAVGYKPQEITFIYVMDLVRAVFLALEAEGVEGKAYFLSDGGVYHSRRFSDLLQEELGNPWVLHIKAPLWFLKAVCAVSGKLNAWMHKTTTLNLDKYHILSQRNWQCDIEPARRDLGYKPEWPLERGVKATVAWYKDNKWL